MTENILRPYRNFVLKDSHLQTMSGVESGFLNARLKKAKIERKSLSKKYHLILLVWLVYTVAESVESGPERLQL